MTITRFCVDKFQRYLFVGGAFGTYIETYDEDEFEDVMIPFLRVFNLREKFVGNFGRIWFEFDDVFYYVLSGFCENVSHLVCLGREEEEDLVILGTDYNNSFFIWKWKWKEREFVDLGSVENFHDGEFFLGFFLRDF